MISPSMQLLQAKQGAKPLSQLGAGISGIVQQKREKDALIAQQQAAMLQQRRYEGAFNNYLSDMSMDNLNALYQNTPAEQQEATQQKVASLTSLERKNKAQANGEIIAGLTYGNIEGVNNALNKNIEVYRDTNPEEFQKWSFVKKLVDEGKTDEANAFLRQSTGLYEEGAEVIRSIEAMDKNRREELATDMDIFKLADGIVFSDTPNKTASAAKGEWVQNLVDSGYTMDMVNKMAAATRFASEIPKEPMDEANLASNALALYDRWQKAAEPFNVVINSYEAMKGLEGMDENGFATQGMITLWNKALDPNSVVRQSEYATTSESIAVLDRLANVFNKLETGEIIGAEVQKDLLKAAEILKIGAEEGLEKSKNGLRPMIDAISENNPTFTEERVFGYNLNKPTTEPVKEEKSTEDLIAEPVKVVIPPVTEEVKENTKEEDITYEELVF